MVYLCLLVSGWHCNSLSPIRTLIPRQMFARMMIVAFVEAWLATVFHAFVGREACLHDVVVIFTGFVLLAMQYGWTDSFRMGMAARHYSNYSK